MKGMEKYFTPFALEQMKLNDVTLEVVGQRLSQGKDLDEVFAYKTRGRKSIYPKWAMDKAKANGITRQTLYHRVKIQGMSIEEAVEKIK